MKIPELGIGIIFFPGFENILESNSDLIQLIEIEPQTFWKRTGSELDPFDYNRTYPKYLQTFAKPLLFHGVGFPVGGLTKPNLASTKCLKTMILDLNPVWLSEHLSFNNIVLDGKVCNTNFLLPPLQTEEGIQIAVTNIRDYQNNFDIPFAFETGTNYLRPQDFEMEDGTFINRVAEQAESHILLDVHNLLANQKNGRQSVMACIRQIDPHKITQIHLAGGFYFKDYYLDAHSNVSSDEVLEIFEKIVKMLPNLKAITFEMIPEYLNFVSPAAIRQQLEKMSAVWDKRGSQTTVMSQKLTEIKKEIKAPSVREWEQTLGRLAIRRPVPDTVVDLNALKNDPGIGIIQALVDEFRRSMLVSSLKFSCRYLLLKYGLDTFVNLLTQYWSGQISKLFTSENGKEFADFLLKNSALVANDEILNALLQYEYFSLESKTDAVKELDLSFNLSEVLESLMAGSLPENISKGNYQVVIDPDLHQSETLQIVMHT